MDNKYNRLMKNTAIYAIGNFGSKVLSFLIVPVYTYFLTTEEYGTIDLFATTAGLVLPFITLSIQEALMRFTLGKEVPGEVAISNCVFIFFLGVIISSCFYPLYSLIFSSTQNIELFYAYVLVSSFTNIFSQYLRSSGDMTSFTVNGVLSTVTLLISNILLIVLLEMGLQGYLVSMFVAQVISMFYIIVKGRIIQQSKFKHVDFSVLKEMLKYSLPLIPNGLMWWAMDGGDKYIINYYLGSSANGIYSLSMKIPATINMLYTLFYQAWQMSAIEEEKSIDRATFYSNIFKVNNALLTMAVIIIIICVKPLYLLVMNSSFQEAWIYVPILSLATLVSCYGSFFGVVYAVNKNTIKASFTTFIGAIVNIGFNIIFVKKLGLQGIALGTLLGYLAVTVIRAKDTYNEIGIDFDTKRLIITILLLISQVVVTLALPTLYIIIIGIIELILLGQVYKIEVGKISQIIFIKLKMRR